MADEIEPGFEGMDETGPPAPDVYTVLLIVSFALILVGVWLVCQEMYQVYDVKFGILS